MTPIENVRGWWQSLAGAPEPLRPGEKLAAWMTFVLVAITRWFAIARTPWDWDEALFMMALRDYNVPAHHPHPPGFPLFVGTAKLLTFVGFSPFHALQAISVCASIAILPAMLLLGRELRLPHATALISGVFLALFPNVWLFGGTGFSDVPSMTLVILAMALLLRGCRSDGAYYGGAILLGIAAGYRPQNLAIGFVPAMIASLYGIQRRWWRVIIAALIGAVIVAGAYGAAAHLSGGWSEYREAVQAHQKYITKIDSFRNPDRPSLLRLFDTFFLRPYKSWPINIIVSLLTAVSVVATLLRLRAPTLCALASFGPFCLLAWLLLDHFSASRFSIGYAPLFGLMAADGLHLITGRMPRLERLAAAVIALLMVVWTWPALREVHRHPSPTFAAATWIRQHVNPASSTLYVHGGMEPLVQAFLPGFPYVPIGDNDTPPVTAAARGDDLFLQESLTPERGTTVFARPRHRLVNIVRDRYFEVTLLRLRQIIVFGAGWHDEEGSGTTIWRWMSGHSLTELPALPGSGRLTMRYYFPLDVLPRPPLVTVRVNGAIVDRFTATEAAMSRSVIVPSRREGRNELVIETDEVVNPARQHINGDSRDLGLRLDDIEWSPVR